MRIFRLTVVAYSSQSSYSSPSSIMFSSVPTSIQANFLDSLGFLCLCSSSVFASFFQLTLHLLHLFSPAVRCTCCAFDFAPTVQQTLHLLHPFHYTVCACMYVCYCIYVRIYVCMHARMTNTVQIVNTLFDNHKNKSAATNTLPGDLVPRGTKSPGDLVPRGTILWGVPNHRDTGT